MNTTAVVITAIIFGSSVVMGIIMSWVEYMELKYNAGVKMEDKLKLEIVETLVDICFALEGLAKYSHTNTRFLRNHAEELAMLSSQYREKIVPKEGEEEALESKTKKPTLCDECERRLECKSKMEITMLRDNLRRFMPPFEGCVMTEKEEENGKELRS